MFRNVVVGEVVDLRKGRRHPDRDRFRLNDIQKLILSRHKGPVDTEDGPSYVEAAAGHLLERDKIVAWARQWTPLVDIHEMMAVADPANPFPRLYADRLARLLGVDMAERTALGLTTIGATDFSKAQRVAARKSRKRDREAKRRQANGARPRSESITKNQPWIAAGFKTRRTWERHGKP